MPDTLHKDYDPVEQFPYYCLPTTLEMIFNRRDLAVGDQRYIGKLMRIRVTPEFGRGHGFVKVTKNPYMLGTYEFHPRFGINRMFSKLGLNLTASLQKKAGIEDPEHLLDCLQKSLKKKSRDTILIVRSSAIEGYPYRKGTHALLLSGVEGRKVHYVDPTGGHKSTTVERLFRAMAISQHHGLVHIDTAKPVRTKAEIPVIA